MSKSDYNSINWKEVFYIDYTSTTGIRWVNTRYRGKQRNILVCCAGDVAGTLRPRPDGTPLGCNVKFNGRNYYTHRIIWCMIYGSIDNKMVIDHIDGNPFNNDISNLRLVPSAVNTQNKSIGKNNKTGVTGVCVLYSRSGTKYYAASFQKVKGVTTSVSFSVKEHGEDLAFSLACDYRKNKIKELNLTGESYTERHGK